MKLVGEYGLKNKREVSLSFITRSPGDEFAWQLSESNPTSVPKLFIASKPESEAVRVNFLEVTNSKIFEKIVLFSLFIS